MIVIMAFLTTECFLAIQCWRMSFRTGSDSPICDCGIEREMADHFLLRCSTYSEARSVIAPKMFRLHSVRKTSLTLIQHREWLLLYHISCTYIIVKYCDITRTLYLTIDSQLVGGRFFLDHGVYMKCVLLTTRNVTWSVLLAPAWDSVTVA